MLKIFFFPKVCENRFRTFVHGTVDLHYLIHIADARLTHSN